MYRNYIKRLLAIILSLGGMICLSWLFLIFKRGYQIGFSRAGLFPAETGGQK